MLSLVLECMPACQVACLCDHKCRCAESVPHFSSELNSQKEGRTHGILHDTARLYLWSRFGYQCLPVYLQVERQHGCCDRARRSCLAALPKHQHTCVHAALRRLCFHQLSNSDRFAGKRPCRAVNIGCKHSVSQHALQHVKETEPFAGQGSWHHVLLLSEECTVARLNIKWYPFTSPILAQSTAKFRSSSHLQTGESC